MTVSDTYEPNEVDEPTVRRAVGAAAMGNLVEWFDYGIYSYVVVYITINLIPGGDRANAGPFFALAIFAVAYLVRPFGGIILGPLGDRIGRKKVLALTIVVMSAASFSIGLLPTYAAIGIAAPILLILLRMVQGFATGGEYGGAAAFIAEYAPDKRRGFYRSFLELGTTGGFVLAAGMVTALEFGLSDPDMESWGWRIPFLIAGPLGLVGLYLRSKLEDTPAFLALERKAQVSESPLRDVLTRHWRPILVCMGLVRRSGCPLSAKLVHHDALTWADSLRWHAVATDRQGASRAAPRRSLPAHPDRPAPARPADHRTAPRDRCGRPPTGGEAQRRTPAGRSPRPTTCRRPCGEDDADRSTPPRSGRRPVAGRRRRTTRTVSPGHATGRRNEPTPAPPCADAADP
jgi:hypothetical protein